MRGAIAAILVGVSVFLLVVAALFRFYAPSRAEKTPLDLDITLVATGPATLGAGGATTVTSPLQATRHVRVDSEASNSDVVVVVETLCIVKLIDKPPACVSATDPKNRLVSLTTDRVAADRKSGEAVNATKYGEYVDSDTSVKHKGMSYKFPFNAKKKSYLFYDPASHQAPTAKYLRTEKLRGIDCYVYEATESGLEVDVAPGIAGKYDDTRRVWVDPLTGTIIKGVEHQVRRLASGEPALDTTLTFDKASIDYQAKQAKDGRKKINLLTVWLPILAAVLGIVLLAGGVFLARSQGGESSGGTGRRRRGNPPPDDGPSLTDDPQWRVPDSSHT